MEQQLVLFDYGQLDAETRIVVQQRAGEIKNLVRATAENIAQIGEKLVDVRARLHNGGFNGWIESEFGWSRRTAYNFIAVYERFRDRANFAQLEIATSALYLLAAQSTPDEAVDEALSRAEAGEKISAPRAQEIINAHKPPPPPELPLATIIKDEAAGPAPWEETPAVEQAEDEYLDDEQPGYYDQPTEEDEAPPQPMTKPAPKTIPIMTPLAASAPDQPLELKRIEPDVLVTIVIKAGGSVLVSLGQVGQPPESFKAASRDTLAQVLEAMLLAHYAPAAVVTQNDNIPVAAPEWLGK